MFKISKIMLVIGVGLIAGCTMEGKNDYGNYYQKQASLNVLKTPLGVTGELLDNYYVVPAGPMADAKAISILPPGSLAYQLALDKNQQNQKKSS
jgi:uncharacterized lipoprotein